MIRTTTSTQRYQTHRVHRSAVAALCLACLSLVWAAAPAHCAGPRQELYELSAKQMRGSANRLSLPTLWKFHPGDDDAFAAHGFDDSAWEPFDTRFRRGESPTGWTGVGWFRLRFRVDPDLRRQAMALALEQVGSAEVYLDGELLYRLGVVHAEPEKAVASFQREPHLFAFDSRSVHVLAVRFCHHDPATAEAIGRTGGFRMTIGEANQRVASVGRDLRTNSSYQALFTGIFAAFALLHLLLFAFYPEARENLWFALLTGCAAAIVYLSLRYHSSTDPEFFQLYERLANVLWLAICVCALGFVYRIFDQGNERTLYALAVLAAALLVPGILWPALLKPWILLLVLTTFFEMCRGVVKALRAGKPGGRIVGLGILVLSGGFMVGLLAGLGVIRGSITTLFLIPLYSMCFLVLSMSVYLSRRFGETHRDLREQLVQVRDLSEQKLQQERRTRETELSQLRLETQYQRKVSELEEARHLQLSMLPELLPELPDLEIAAGMHTATEVGGDYYDFDLADDGTLTVAIGDATGHGMKAGTMVTATKSLFHALGADSDLPLTLTRFTRALKRMNLRQLSMALTLVKFKDGRLRLAAAGMPPALVYRAGTGTVETLLVEGAPLGSLTGFPYRQTEFDLAPGDTVLLMSDGFPERLNHEDEMLGYDKAEEAFGEAASTSPRVIIERLVAAGESWANGQPARDDMTFVVMKRRGV